MARPFVRRAVAVLASIIAERMLRQHAAGAASALGSAVRDQPFVAPAVRPPTMYFCSSRKTMTTGIAAITAPAAKADQSA